MRIKRFHKLLSFLLIIAIYTGCNQDSNQSSFELKGKLNGITNGKAIFKQTKQLEDISDTILIHNGEFIFTATITEPVEYEMSIEGNDGYKSYFYAENTKMTMTAHVDSLWQASIEGGTINEEQHLFYEDLQKLASKFEIDSLSAQYYRDTSDVKNKQKLMDAYDKFEIAYEENKLNYIKQNPSSYFSAILVQQMSSRANVEEIEKYLALLDPKLDEFSVVEDLRAELHSMKTTDISLDKFMGEVPDVGYTVDTKYAGTQHKGIKYLAILKNDNLCALTKDGNIVIIDPGGKKISEIKSTLKSIPSSVAVDQNSGNIYVLGTNLEVKERKVRGKSYKIENENGVECIAYDSEGNQLKKLQLDGIKSATGAKVKDDKLIVADFTSKQVVCFNLETGAKLSSIDNLRACCKILDFGLNNKNEVLVANLGAFRVQAFDYSGKIKYAFGRRGSGINDFHGCCNPVNATSLTNGAIVTVEKDPTRIKVYSKSGAKQIEGIQELVKGCAYIPMAADSRNNIYLASAQSGIVKCIVKSMSK